MNSRLKCKINVEGNWRLDLKKKIGISPMRDLIQKTMKR